MSSSFREVKFYCNGVKTCEKRVLLEEPALLPVNVEGLANLSDIPAEVEIDKWKYV